MEVSGPTGSGKTEFALQCLAAHATTPTLWIETGEALSFYPRALSTHGVDPEQVIFALARDGREREWIARQALASQAFGFVIISEVSDPAELELRRWQISAERARTTVVLLRDSPRASGAWPIALQLEASRPVVVPPHPHPQPQGGSHEESREEQRPDDGFRPPEIAPDFAGGRIRVLRSRGKGGGCVVDP